MAIASLAVLMYFGVLAEGAFHLKTLLFDRAILAKPLSSDAQPLAVVRP